jgi:hypothetical protein
VPVSRKVETRYIPYIHPYNAASPYGTKPDQSRTAHWYTGLTRNRLHLRHDLYYRLIARVLHNQLTVTNPIGNPICVARYLSSQLCLRSLPLCLNRLPVTKGGN